MSSTNYILFLKGPDEGERWWANQTFVGMGVDEHIIYRLGQLIFMAGKVL